MKRLLSASNYDYGSVLSLAASERQRAASSARCLGRNAVSGACAFLAFISIPAIYKTILG